MVTENSDNTDEVVEETPKKTKAKKPKYDAVQELPEYDADLKQYIFSFRIINYIPHTNYAFDYLLLMYL